MTNVFIVDDHQLVIEGITSILQKEKDIKVAGYATNATACINYFKTNTADVILMDINLPDISGLDLCKAIKSDYPVLPLLH